MRSTIKKQNLKSSRQDGLRKVEKMTSTRPNTNAVAIATFILTTLFVSSYTHPNYVPNSACSWMSPWHEPYVEPQQGKAPYKFKIYHPHVLVNMTVPLCIIGAEPFKGLMIQAQDMEGNAIGYWITDSGRIQTLNCTNEGDTVTHSNSNNKQILPIKWRAPEDYEGKVVFKGAIVKSYSTFWTNIASDTFSVHSTKSKRNVMAP
ncbi:putative defense protein 3 [Macrobrachium rosenbergii]|uniref:putative defense protein 3 n=1 Tax=Macrobrachium rosenbergii TaxID=79674 RepID=UPI0034D42157